MIRNRTPFTVTMSFRSDWIIGTGRGIPGGVDEVVRRDADGLPFVPGKSVKGMLRDAAEQVARSFDTAPEGRWHDWLAVLFGAASNPGVLQVRSLHLAAPIRDRIGLRSTAADAAEIRAELIVVRAGVAIERKSRTARPDHLRFGERARAGIDVQGEWTLELDGDEGAEVPAELELLLRAGVRLIDHVGKHRRRGAGKVAVELADGERRLGKLLDHFEKEEPRDPAEVLSVVEALAGSALPSVAVRAGAIDERLRTIDLRITAVSPVISTAVAIGNVVTSLPFLPGGRLLPLVHRAVGDLQPLLAGGRIVVTDGTVELDGTRSLPTPAAVALPKRSDLVPGERLTVLDAATDMSLRPRAVGLHCVVTVVDPAAESSGPPQFELVLGDPGLQVDAHAVIDDVAQRPTSQSGGMYAYQAIEARTVLRAQVRIVGAVDVPRIVQRLTGRTSVGRSRQDEYGLVEVEAREVEATSAIRPLPPAGDLVTVWLTSDLLLRDQFGNPNPTVEELARQLGVRLGLRLTPSPDVRDCLLTVNRRESWHAATQLPRPSLIAVARGSVARLRFEGRLPDDYHRRRSDLELSGLGDRTAEGFGQLLIDPPVLEKAAVVIAAHPSPPALATAPADDLDYPSWWADVELAAMKARIVRAAGEACRFGSVGGVGALSASQRGLFRLFAAGPTAGFCGQLERWRGSVTDERSQVDIRAYVKAEQIWAALKLSPRPMLVDYAGQQLLLASVRSSTQNESD